MIRVLHLSDLHFGRDRPELQDPLLARIDALAPDVVAISGDFTQRARIGQFERASAFVDRIAQPVISVPGNHDTPLDNIWIRMLRPWARYRDAIDSELEPVMETPAAVLAGVNTVNRFSWQRGRMSRRTVTRVCDAFADAGDRVRIVVLHHPLEHGQDVDKRLMRGAEPALAALQECGADMVLSGHLHHTITAPFGLAQGLLFVQAGTGLSSRHRGDRNTFNLIEADRRRIAVQTWQDDEGDDFRPFLDAAFTRQDGVWRRADA
ncbi:putative phospodiesterase [Oceaniovalibus guishaninsula JLT2003]|uniref:Putative phospodiesterase n=1 Tax=Oceaniovalibus guishaninsula JLT2003 TaxID=1231392 RepID=K2HD12_9RHOB|nr:metallophosphoesterase family protein [Oceaniovalibus guishaninsula]EKE44472.1 putative phospodiesterase [Oceaniovalibus guishaninsula JLT2003]